MNESDDFLLLNNEKRPIHSPLSTIHSSCYTASVIKSLISVLVFVQMGFVLTCPLFGAGIAQAEEMTMGDYGMESHAGMQMAEEDSERIDAQKSVMDCCDRTIAHEQAPSQISNPIFSLLTIRSVSSEDYDDDLVDGYFLDIREYPPPIDFERRSVSKRE